MLDGAPADVVARARRHPAFPHESTADQFFDEAQWESYRRLGEHIASRVFEDVAGGWRPLDFCQPPLAGIRWRGASRTLEPQDPRSRPGVPGAYA